MADLESQRIAELEAEIARLRSREQDLADFVENAAVPLHWVAVDGTILWANRAELELLGYTSEEYIGRDIVEFHVDRDAIDDILRRLGARETLHDYEARLRHKDGSIRQVLITSSARWDEEGRFLHTRCFTRDVTDRKRVEGDLHNAQVQLQLITQNMPAAVSRCSRELRYLWVSQGYAAWLGRSFRDIAGRPIRDVVGERGFEEIRPHIERVLSGKRVEYTTQVHFSGPGERWVHAVYAPTRSTDGNVDGWVAVITDITERRAMGLANAHLAAVIASSEDAIISKDLNGTIMSWNTAAERIYGYTAAEAIGQNMLLLLPQERQKEEADILARLRRGISYRTSRRPGSRKPGRPSTCH
jgi:PAS domain S-box-containing protein